MIKKEVLTYLIKYLLGNENQGLHEYVYYKVPENTFGKGIYIVPSGFFDEGIYLTEKSLPQNRIDSVEGIISLFGKDKCEAYGNYIVLYADIIASAFFLVTRYEEYVRRDCRDQHGRFIGRESTQYKFGILQEPVVNQYGCALLKMLNTIGIRTSDTGVGVKKVYLTHDIDIPWSVPENVYKRFKIFIRSMAAIVCNKNREIHKKKLKILFHRIDDPADTFDFLIEQDASVKCIYHDKFDSLYFLMVCEKGAYDLGYIEEEAKTHKLVDKLKASGAKFGIHIGYQAGGQPYRIKGECEKYQSFMGEMPKWSRHHYLMCREPEDYYDLLENGVTDDFSCCFADGGGFRLGTCRPVKWIDPVKMEITGLMLHPLFATEGKLCQKEYMGMGYDEALSYLYTQIDKIKQYQGEVVILFHNTSVSIDNKYHLREMYVSLVKYIRELGENDCNHMQFK